MVLVVRIPGMTPSCILLLWLSFASDPRPPADFALYFPDRDYCQQMIALNRGYRGWCLRMMAEQPWREEEWGEAHREAMWLFSVWDALDTVQLNGIGCDYRRTKLQELRGWLGETAFWQHLMPPPVPVWRYRKLK